MIKKMFKITFENTFGKIEMGGGSHEKMNVTAISGFGNPSKECKTVSFSGQAGAVTTSVRELSRTLTVAGIFKGSAREVSDMYKILSFDGALKTDFDGDRKKITCRAVSTDGFERMKGSGMYKFALQFQADNPYFTDWEKQVYSIFERKDLVTSPFTLPTVFTKRVNVKTEVNVKSEDVVYPTIVIKNDSGAAAGDSFGFKIVNEDTGKQIEILYAVQAGETVTADLSRRIITASESGSITNCISDNTVLSDFYLKPGKNRITVLNYDNSLSISAYLMYDNAYRTAVY